MLAGHPRAVRVRVRDVHVARRPADHVDGDAAEDPRHPVDPLVADHDEHGAGGLRGMDQRLGRLARLRVGRDRQVGVRRPQQVRRLAGLELGRVARRQRLVGRLDRLDPGRRERGDDEQVGTQGVGQRRCGGRGQGSGLAAVDADDDDAHLFLLGSGDAYETSHTTSSAVEPRH
jgi:hypothetical protein